MTKRLYMPSGISAFCLRFLAMSMQVPAVLQNPASLRQYYLDQVMRVRTRLHEYHFQQASGFNLSNSSPSGLYHF